MLSFPTDIKYIRDMKKFMIKYSPYIIGVIIGLMFGDRFIGGFFYDLGTKFGEWLGNLIF